MADFLTKEERSVRMSHIHSTSTTPELKLRHALWRQGFRYRVNDKRLPGSPDILLPKYRTAIFVNGCFWHGHQNCKVFHIPDTNPEFWASKIDRNRARDINNWHALEVLGWNVITIWECELEKSKFQDTLDQTVSQILANGAEYHFRLDERKATNKAYREMRKEQKDRDAVAKQEIATLLKRG